MVVARLYATILAGSADDHGPAAASRPPKAVPGTSWPTLRGWCGSHWWDTLSPAGAETEEGEAGEGGGRQLTALHPRDPRWRGVGFGSRSFFGQSAKTRLDGETLVSHFPSEHTTPTQDPIQRPSAYITGLFQQLQCLIRDFCKSSGWLLFLIFSLMILTKLRIFLQVHRFLSIFP